MRYQQTAAFSSSRNIQNISWWEFVKHTSTNKERPGQARWALPGLSLAPPAQVIAAHATCLLRRSSLCDWLPISLTYSSTLVCSQTCIPYILPAPCPTGAAVPVADGGPLRPGPGACRAAVEHPQPQHEPGASQGRRAGLAHGLPQQAGRTPVAGRAAAATHAWGEKGEDVTRRPAGMRLAVGSGFWVVLQHATAPYIIIQPVWNLVVVCLTADWVHLATACLPKRQLFAWVCL